MIIFFLSNLETLNKLSPFALLRKMPQSVIMFDIQSKFNKLFGFCNLFVIKIQTILANDMAL